MPYSKEGAILYVEDAPDLMEVTVMWFETFIKRAVLTAKDPDQAGKLLTTKEIALVITDGLGGGFGQVVQAALDNGVSNSAILLLTLRPRYYQSVADKLSIEVMSKSDARAKLPGWIQSKTSE